MKRMNGSRSPLYLGLMAAFLTVGASVAQAKDMPAIVPPPVAPGAKAPVVAPAQTVNSLTPSGGVRATLPSAPKPVPPPEAKLNMPSAPISNLPQAPAPSASSSSVLSATLPSAPKTAPPVRKKSDSDDVLNDPFTGLQMTPVSDSQLNRFVFPEPIEGIYFSEGAPLPECPDNAGAQDPCKPVFLNGKRMMLLQFRAGAKGPVQMLAHLKSGRVLTLNLAPAAGPGAIIRLEGAEDGASDARLLAARQTANTNPDGVSASEQYVALLSRFAKGEIPSGFEAEGVGPAVRFEYFDVIPMAAWGDGSQLRAHLFQVKAHGNQPVAISTSLFRTEQVKAIALDRETITHDQPAMLYVLEYLPEYE